MCLFIFLLTRPSRGATPQSWKGYMENEISTHTPLAGRDGNCGAATAGDSDFYSHAPRGARLGADVYWSADNTISTHTPLAGRDRDHRCKNRHLHAFLLTRPSRGATRTDEYFGVVTDFYSHAPRGARHQLPEGHVLIDRFLLTRPSRGATPPWICRTSPRRFLLTRPSRGATMMRWWSGR